PIDSFAADVSFLDGATGGFVCGIDDVAGSLLPGLFDTTGAQVSALPLTSPPDLIGMTALGGLLVLGARDEGAVFVDSVSHAAVLRAPDVPDVADVEASARGVLVADGASGAAWFPIR
ncbi:MAG TPA: hypothetical protein VGO62_08850, partial [Myxococcota bacterium]